MTTGASTLRLAVVNQHDEGGATAAAKEVLAWGPSRGIDVRWFPDPKSPDDAADLLAQLAADPPDLVHVHCWYQAFDYELLQRLGERLPVVFTVHDVYVVNQYGVECWECYRNALCFGCPGLEMTRRWRPNYRTISRWRKRRVNRRTRVHLIYPSEWMRRRLSRSEWAKHPSTVIPYSIDTDRFSPGEVPRAAFGLPDGPLALFVGNMYSAADHRKGVPDLLLAWPAVRAQVPDATLAIAGRVEGITSSEGVQLLGEIGGDRLPDLYRAADLLVLPTRGDNLPVAVLEAAASGLPAVGTRVGGVPEEVLDGKSGLLVSPGDEAALAAEMAALLSDPSLRTSFGRAAREHAVTRFSRSASARDHERLYRSLV